MCWEHTLAYSWAKSSNTKSTVSYRTQYLKWKAEWMYQLFTLVISWLTRSYCSLLLPSISGVSEGISLGQEKIQNSTHSLYWNVSPNIYIYGSCESEYIHIYIHLHCGVVRYKTFFCLLKQEQVMPFKGGLVGFRILHLETTLSLCVNYYICRIYIIDIYKIYNYMPIKNITLTSSLCPSQERV